jgi:hypothetical protein
MFSALNGPLFEGKEQAAWSLAPWAFGLHFLTIYVGIPLFGGLFTAKLAGNRPLLHVAVVTVIGIAFFSFVTGRNTASLVLVLAVFWVCASSLGAFLVMRRAARRTQ